MSTKLYVGNLPYGTTDPDLQCLFAQYGPVQSAQIIFDRDTGRSKDCGLVEMANDHDAHAAISALSGLDADGRQLTVNEALSYEHRRFRSISGARCGY